MGQRKMALPPIAKPMIYAPAKLYELGVRSRIALYDNHFLKTHRLNAPVISVGNLTVGGTGKTPCVAFLANFLRAEGYSVAILSRGYKRATEGRVEVSNGREILCQPREAGDEPYLLAMSCPGVRVIVDEDRYAAGNWIERRERINVFLLDDGFQHLRLARDLNLVLIDASESLDAAEMVPFGRLREPLTGLRRANAIIVTRSDRPADREALEETIAKYAWAGTPILYASHEMTGLRRLPAGEADLSMLAGEPVAALSGIARPDRFVEDLTRLGLRVVSRHDFEDHHRYTRIEFAAVVGRARAAGAAAIVTTEKDAMNLSEEIVRSSALPVYAARIEFRCENEEELKRLALQAVLQSPSE
jgi:tetraacyldisaccharide 4'-kinase